MARSTKALGDDVVRTAKALLRYEQDLRMALGEGNDSKAWEAAVKLKRMMIVFRHSNEALIERLKT